MKNSKARRREIKAHNSKWFYYGGERSWTVVNDFHLATRWARQRGECEMHPYDIHSGSFWMTQPENTRSNFEPFTGFVFYRLHFQIPVPILVTSRARTLHSFPTLHSLWLRVLQRNVVEDAYNSKAEQFSRLIRPRTLFQRNCTFLLHHVMAIILNGRSAHSKFNSVTRANAHIHGIRTAFDKRMAIEWIIVTRNEITMLGYVFVAGRKFPLNFHELLLKPKSARFNRLKEARQMRIWCRAPEELLSVWSIITGHKIDFITTGSRR